MRSRIGSSLAATLAALAAAIILPGGLAVGRGLLRDGPPHPYSAARTLVTRSAAKVARYTPRSGQPRAATAAPAAGPPQIDIATVNPGDVVERDLCLTVAAGPDAAMECGDLRLAHPLPAVRTLNKARAPTLLYNSQHAHPYPVVAANVTMPSGSAVPERVAAEISVNGILRAEGAWSGSDWTPGSTRRIAIGFDALNDPTGIVSYELKVRNFYGQAKPMANGVAAGTFHTCGLGAGGQAYCWGFNSYGQLGIGSTGGSQSTPTAIAGGLAFTKITSGGYHSCALTAAGQAYCWGANTAGQLGDGTNTHRNAPVAVSTSLTFASIDAGWAYTCAVTPAGAAYCWGANESGELGDLTLTNRNTPAAVSGGLAFGAVAAGQSHTCGVTPAGAAYCWGLNGSGQLGDGTGGLTGLELSPTPLAVAGSRTYTRIDVGVEHSCAVATGGAPYCWGASGKSTSGDYGNKLGIGTSAPNSCLPSGDPCARSPVAVLGNLTATEIGLGGAHTCALTTAGRAYCWGNGMAGRIGDGLWENRDVPTAVVGSRLFTALSVGNGSACAVSGDGQGYCWGGNDYGVLGDGTTTHRASPVISRGAAGTGTQDSTSQTGQVAVVNRSASPFGAGWWLAGLERLDTATMVWVGGDGSVRRYQPTGIANVWAAPAVDRPDTLKFDPSRSRYVRYLPHGVRVEFDPQGRHVATVNRLGHTTRFTYDGSGRLDSLVVPPAGAALHYRFVYTGAVLDSVIAPPAGMVARATKVTTDVSPVGSLRRVTALRDPDGSSVRFINDTTAAAPFSNLVTARLNRLGDTTRYRYSVKVAQTSIVMVSAPPIVTNLTAAAIRGLVGSASPDAMPPDSAYALVNGPRQDTTVTRFWLDRFGAPTKIVTALGDSTVLTRGNTTFPALVTQVRAPGGFTTQATYDGRGNMASSTEVNPLGDSQNAVTRYEWDTAWDFVTKIVPPERDSVLFRYDPATGNRTQQQNARGDSVVFGYGSSCKLLSSSKTMLSPRDSVEYDARCNVSATRTPLGYWTSFVGDVLGRDTLVITPIDSADTGRGGLNTTRTQRWISYDVMDRVTRDSTWGPAKWSASSCRTGVRRGGVPRRSTAGRGGR